MHLSICFSPCPFLCPYDWKTHWKEERNHCGFVFLTPPLIGLEPKSDPRQPPVPQPVGQIREKRIIRSQSQNLTLLRKIIFSTRVRIQNTTITSGSKIDGPAHQPHHQMSSTGSKDQVTSNSDVSPEMLCAICSSCHSVTAPAKMNRAALFQSFCFLCLVHGGLGRPKHYATVSTIAVYSVSFSRSS